MHHALLRYTIYELTALVETPYAGAPETLNLSAIWPVTKPHVTYINATHAVPDNEIMIRCCAGHITKRRTR